MVQTPHETLDPADEGGDETRRRPMAHWLADGTLVVFLTVTSVAWIYAVWLGATKLFGLFQ